MHLFILTTALLLLPQASTLKCSICENNMDCKEMQCPDNNQCGALRMSTYAGGTEITNIQTKSCVAPQQCIRGSVNFGLSKVVITGDCCSTDMCNSKITPGPPMTTPNGKKCYVCDGSGDCSSTLNCVGDEDQCIKASVTALGKTMTLKGCISTSMCQSSSMPIPGMDTGISCCKGDFCNGVSGVSASLLVLATTLISVLLLSN